MKRVASLLLALAALLSVSPSMALAADTISQVAVQGYDVVSYQQDSGPKRGSGHHAAVYEGATYLFSSTENKAAFEANPAKYAPAYGGYCAYGVVMGKKFAGDPLVYKVVDGKLYLNLDQKITEMWRQDIPGNIQKGDAQWKSIRNTAASAL